MTDMFAFLRPVGDETARLVGIRGDLYSEDLAAGGGDTEQFCKVFMNNAVPGMTCIDVGANIGVTTALMAAMCPNSTIIALEPSKQAFACLQRVADLNRGPKYHLLNVGAGSVNGQATFVQDNASISASFFSSDITGETTEIRTVDSLIDQYGLDRLDFIKIDVEGFEPHVLDGMTNTKRFGPLVYMEFNSWALGSSGIAHMPFLKRILDEYRYFVYWDRSTGKPVSVETLSDARTFLHNNMVKNGCVDDIAFSTDEDRMKAVWLGLKPRNVRSH